VGTKRQASGLVADSAKRCGQFYVNHHWLGGTLTNWKTISVSIRRLREFDEKLAEENLGLTKKETLRLTRMRDKLEQSLGGIKEMGGLPDILFVIDTNREAIAVAEANKLGIPVVAVVDSNCDPSQIEYPFPGNDDAIRAMSLYCNLFAGAVLDGLQREMLQTGTDTGEAEEPPVEGAVAAGEAAAKDAEPEKVSAAPEEAKAEEPPKATEPPAS